MAKKELQSLSLKELIADQPLYSKVVNMLDQKQSYRYILKYLATKGYKMSTAGLTHLKDKLTESRETGVPIEMLGDKRSSKKEIQEHTAEQEASLEDVLEHATGYTGEQEAGVAKPIPVYSSEQLLEELLKKGMHTIQESDFIDLPVVLKTLELYEKYYGAKNRGLTGEALKQYQLIMQAQQTAMTEVFLQYVPKTRQQEALKALEQRSQEILTQIGATKEGKELLKQLDRAGLEMN